MIVLSHRTLLFIVSAIAYLLCLQCFTLYTINGNKNYTEQQQQENHHHTSTVPIILKVREERNNLNTLRINNNHPPEEFICRWYIAESAMPNSGLGVYTGIGLHKGEDIGYPDICLYVNDGNFGNTQLSSHTWGASNYFGSIEGSRGRAACEGLATIVNTAHPSLINTNIISQELQTNAGLHRATSPGAGAITHNYGIHGRARDIIPAGSELIVDYFDWDFSHITEPIPPKRDVPWLQQHGWCIDKIHIGPSTIPHAGRGAFARTYIQQNEVIAPAPLQVFRNRNVFQTIQPEQLIINYCLQAEKSSLVFFPYGQAVNLINHSSKNPNVEWRWSTKTSVHHTQWLDLSLKEFWKVAKPGGLILEIVALRDIQPGEELVINYGTAWENAWNQHVAQWKPPENADQYVYPAEMDETEQLRTVDEQMTNPYPNNIATVCVTPDVDRQKHNPIEWFEPENNSWYDSMSLCHILSRDLDKSTGSITYTVSLLYSRDKYEYNPNINRNDLYIDTKVPRRAIRFVEKPYHDDEHIENAFRHPIILPPSLLPKLWLNNKNNNNNRFKQRLQRQPQSRITNDTELVLPGVV
jgi:hypothetical protein